MQGIILSLIAIVVGSFAAGFNVSNLIHLSFDKRDNETRNSRESANDAADGSDNP